MSQSSIDDRTPDEILAESLVDEALRDGTDFEPCHPRVGGIPRLCWVEKT